MSTPTHKVKPNYDGLAFKAGQEVKALGNRKYQALTREKGNRFRKEGWVEDHQIESL